MKSGIRKYTGPKFTYGPHLLTGLLRCGLCGAPYTMLLHRKGVLQYYRCAVKMKKGTGTCNNINFAKQKLQNLVISKIKEHILNEKNVYELIQMTNEKILHKRENKEYDRERIKALLDDTSKRLKNLREAVEALGLNPERSSFAERIKELEDQRDGYLDALHELMKPLEEPFVAEPQLVKKTLKELEEFLLQSDAYKVKTFLQYLIEKIEAFPDHIVIHYTFPLESLSAKGQKAQKSNQEPVVLLYAEREGFEPSIEFWPYNGLANRRLQPLGHLSMIQCQV